MHLKYDNENGTKTDWNIFNDDLTCLELYVLFINLVKTYSSTMNQWNLTNE